MNDFTFSQADLEDIKAHGLSPEKAAGHLQMFARGVSAPVLIAPCTINNGITVLGPGSVEQLTTVFRQAATAGRVTKFVPASGAATRMFKALIQAYQDADDKTSASDKNVATLMDNISRFACHDALKKSLEKNDLDCDDLIATGRHDVVLECLLTPKGLSYAGLPKGLIPFHRYHDESTGESYFRTAFEEHLAEAAELFADQENRCSIHFTVPLTHESAIKEHIRSAGEHVLKQHGVRPEVTFSTQNPATDTLAVTENNTPFRDRKGRLVFRPGGHGALLENLENLKGDIIFIKNIDNIAVEPVRGKTAPAITAMCGLLVELQQRIFTFLERLTSDGTGTGLVQEIADWASENLNLALPDTLTADDPAEARNILTTRLNRPLRVCGVVKNVGEPGGGPFWVKDSRGEIFVQIIEAAQVDMNDDRQKQIWRSATHFNPVIIACAVRDFTGRPFSLKDFSDPLAGIITEKSKDGQNLKALEHPGLWNGAMAFWNTVFVELPPDAFNPVKTLSDLLREGHCHETDPPPS